MKAYITYKFTDSAVKAMENENATPQQVASAIREGVLETDGGEIIDVDTVTVVVI